MILISGFRREQGRSNTKGKYTKIHLQHNHCTQNKNKKAHLFNPAKHSQRTTNKKWEQRSTEFDFPWQKYEGT